MVVLKIHNCMKIKTHMLKYVKCSTTCSSSSSCLCLSAPECTQINGNEPNSASCICGTKRCSDAGSYCDKSTSTCRTVPYCNKEDEQINDVFGNVRDVVMKDPLVFGDFSNAVERLRDGEDGGFEDPQLYEDQNTYVEVRQVFDDALEEYNLEKKPQILKDQNIEMITSVKFKRALLKIEHHKHSVAVQKEHAVGSALKTKRVLEKRIASKDRL